MQEKHLIQFFKKRLGNGKRRWGCPDGAQIAAYADRQLSGQAKERVETHLADCDFCMDQLGFLMRSRNAVMPEIVPAHLLRRAQNLVSTKERAEGSAWWHWGKIAAASATACLVIVAAISLRQSKTVPGPGPRMSAVVVPSQVPPQIAPKVRAVPSHAPSVRGGKQNRLSLALSFPADGATLSEDNIQFRWQAAAGAQDYEVQVLTAEGDLVWKQGAVASPLRLPGVVKLESGRKYFVRVRAHLAGGKTVDSAPVAFTVTSH